MPSAVLSKAITHVMIIFEAYCKQIPSIIGREKLGMTNDISGPVWLL